VAVAAAGVAVAVAGVGAEAAAAASLSGQRVEIPLGAQIGLFLTVAFTIVFGVWPAPLFDFVHAARLLF